MGGSHTLSGEYKGRDALFAYFARVRELTGGTLVLHPASIAASGEHIAMYTRVTARRSDKTLDVVLSQTFKVGPDGRWVEYWAVPDDQEAIDEFWS